MESLADVDYLKDVVLGMVDGLSLLSKRYKEEGGGEEIDPNIFTEARKEVEILTDQMRRRYEYDEKIERQRTKKDSTKKDGDVDPSLFQLASLWSCKQALLGTPEAAMFDKIIFEQIKEIVKAPKTDHSASFFEPPISTHTEAFFAKSKIINVDMDKLYSIDILDTKTNTSNTIDSSVRRQYQISKNQQQQQQRQRQIQIQNRDIRETTRCISAATTTLSSTPPCIMPTASTPSFINQRSFHIAQNSYEGHKNTK